MENTKNFACAINCMDGRIQDAVKKYMQYTDVGEYNHLLRHENKELPMI